MSAMTYNFRRFSARIGIVFGTQDHLGEVLKWKNPAETASYLLICTLILVFPLSILPIVPGILLLLKLLIPSFEVRHALPSQPPQLLDVRSNPKLENELKATRTDRGPPRSVSGFGLGSLIGSDNLADSEPVIPAPTSVGKPAPVESRDFLLNMRDIQNLMADYSDSYDKIRDIVVPATNFAQENISSQIATAICVFCVLWPILTRNVFVLELLRWSSIVSLWTLVLSFHPKGGTFVKHYFNGPLAQHGNSIMQEIEFRASNDYIAPSHHTKASISVEMYEYQVRLELPSQRWSNSIFTAHTPPSLSFGLHYTKSHKRTSSKSSLEGSNTFQEVERIGYVTAPNGYKFADSPLNEWRHDEGNARSHWVRQIVLLPGEDIEYPMHRDRKGRAKGWIVVKSPKSKKEWRIRRWTRIAEKLQ